MHFHFVFVAHFRGHQTEGYCIYGDHAKNADGRKQQRARQFPAHRIQPGTYQRCPNDEPEAVDLPVPTVTKQYISYLVTEKTSYSLFDVIRTQKHEDVFLKMNVHDIENITTQLTHTLYVMRHSFGSSSAMARACSQTLSINAASRCLESYMTGLR